MNTLVSISANRPANFSPQAEVAVCYIECEGRLLFLKRAPDKLEGNTWGVPGGKLEEGETSLQAVKREVFEEVGIQLGENRLNLAGKLYISKPHLTYVFHMFSEELPKLPTITLSDESTTFRWVTLEEALELPLISGGTDALHYLKPLIAS